MLWKKIDPNDSKGAYDDQQIEEVLVFWFSILISLLL